MKNFWQKHKKRILKVVAWYFIAIIFIFVIPIGINWAYKTPASLSIFSMDWEAKDVLSFYGSLLGATATIIALRETIRFTRESQKEERKLSVKPRLESKYKHFNSEIYSINSKDSFVYVDYSKEGIVSQESIPKETASIIALYHAVENLDSYSDTEDFMGEACLQMYKDGYLTKHFYILYELFNYGANNALEVEFRINNSIVCPGFCISQDKPKRFMLIFDENILENNCKEIEITITYTDICSIAKYKQTERFTIFKAENTFETMQAFENKLNRPVEIQHFYNGD